MCSNGAVRLPLTLLPLSVGAILPTAAGARVITYGSTLRAAATIAETHPVDSAFWPVAAPHGRSVRAPRTGQILAIRLKGTALRHRGRDPVSEVHFQHLRPRSGGRMLVVQTSQPFDVPVGGARNTITTFRPENLCVRRGDVIAFNDEGGFVPSLYPSGTPFRVFGRVPGARTARYTRGGGTLSGATMAPRVRSREELLMQLRLGTGDRVSGACRAFNAQR